MSLDVGSVKGSIVVGDEFSATFTAIDAKIAKLQSDFEALSAKLKDHSNKTKVETDKVQLAYNKLAASLDPVVAGEQKLAKAHETLDAALKKGLITQQQHHALLEKSKEKYSNLENPLVTLRSRVGELTETIAKFGGEAGEGLNKVASGLLGMGASAGTAVAELGPLLPIIAGIAAVAATLSVGIKLFDWLKEVTEEGIKTQGVIEQLNATLRINGSNSGLSAKQMVEFAESLELATGKGKEEIVQTETILSRFSHLGSSFKDVTKLTLDLAQAKGVDASTMARVVGPAYEGNIRSLRSLKDEGIVFTQAQSKTLQSMIDQGKIMEYQALLTDVLKEKVEGLAEAHGRTLAGQIEKGKIVYEEFGESIASDIIPALEDVLTTIVDQVGGWENLKLIVQSVGHDIGDAIRKMVYGAMDLYLQWDEASHKLDATLKSVFAEIIEGAGKVARALGIITADPVKIAASKELLTLANDLRESAMKDAVAVMDDMVARDKLAAKMVQHRQALEGDEEVQKKHANTLGLVTGKLKENVNVLIDFEKQLRAVTEAMTANLLKSSQSVSDQERLLKASLNGVRAYEVEKAAIEAETKVRERQAEITKELAKIQDAATTALQKLDEALKHGKVTAADYAHQHTQIEIEAKAATAAVQASAAAIDLNTTKANLARIATTAWLEISKNLTAQNEAMGKSIGEVNLQIINLQKSLDKQLSGKQADFIDWQAQSNFANKYGKDLEGIYEKYGLLSQATEALALQERILAAQETARAKNKDVSDAELARIRNLIIANQEATDAIQAQWVAIGIKKWVIQPVLDGVEQYKQAGIDAFNSWLETGKFDTESFKKAFLDITIKMIEEWLKRWLTAIAARNAADAALGAGGGLAGAGGASGGGMGGVASFASSAVSRYYGSASAGAGGAGGAGSSSLGASFSSWGSMASYAFLAWVGLEIYKGWTEKRVTSGSFALGGGSSGNFALATKAREVIQELVRQVTDIANQWHLGLQQLTSGSVRLEVTSKGAIIVHTLLDPMGKVFYDMAQALEYAKVQALKFATFSTNTSELVRAAIARSTAIDTAGLQRDIDFATRLATQNLPELGRQMTDWLNQFVDDFKHVMDLFGPTITSRITQDFSQLGPAIESVVTQFSTSLWGLYNQLTGRKQDMAALQEQQRVAFNAQRAIMIAQIMLMIEETKARIALYQGTALGMGGGSGLGPQGPGAGGTGSTGGPVDASGYTKEGEPTPDDRNPNNDPRISALLAVLDNLARALQGLPPALNPGDVHVGGGGRGGGAGGGAGQAIDSLRQMIADVNRLIAQSKLSDLAKQIDDIDKKWDDELDKLGDNSNALARIKKAHDEAIKAANGNKEAIDKANAAYQKQLGHIAKTKEAIDAANAAREKEIALARQQATEKLRDSLRAYTSEFGFSDWQKRQAANERQHQQDIKDQVGTGIPKWQVELANFNRGVELAGDAVSSLGLPLQGLIDKSKILTGTVDFLHDSVSKGTLSLDKFNSIWAELINQSKLDLLTLASQIAQSAGDDAKAAEIKAKMDEINFAIQRAQFNILLDQYEVLGTITGADKEYMEGLRDWINNLHPDFTAAGNVSNSNSLSSSADTLSSATTTFQSAVDQFKQATDSLLASFNSIFGSTNQLGGSAQDRLAIAQSQFRSIEQGALAGDVTARGKYGAAAENYLSVLNEANAGGALFGAERDRLKAEFEQLLAMTRFSLNGVSYDSRLGAPITPPVLPGQPNLGGYSGPAVGNSGSGSGSLSSDMTGVLQQILVALLTSNANTTPALNSISNNTARATTSTQTVNANLDRLIAAVYQWLNAA